MARNTGFIAGFRGLDAFGRTLEDVRIRTHFGACLTFLSFLIIAVFAMIEFHDYRQVEVVPFVTVDKSRGERLAINLNVTFPRVPCYLMSIDVMDISGDHLKDLSHDIIKSRLAADGSLVEQEKAAVLKGDVERQVVQQNAGFCGSCYGGIPPESGCCNSCDEVREAYTRRGWSFTKPSGIDQCIEEGWAEKIAAQSSEGCNIAGQVRVNKVVGNFHLSPGKSFQANSMQVQDLVPYLKDGTHHDFAHTIHHFSFGDGSFEPHPTTQWEKVIKDALTADVEMHKKLNIVNPLNGVTAKSEESNYMFQYFVKTVANDYTDMEGKRQRSHSYSVTSYERDLSKPAMNDAQGHRAAHGMMGIPGVFFNYEISPIKIDYYESRKQTFAQFLSSTCAIIGGVLTVAGLIDAAVYNSQRSLKRDSSEDSSFSMRGKLL